MDFSVTTVREMLDQIQREPTRLEPWRSLLIACFDQRDSVTFESLQIIADGLEEAWVQQRAKPRMGVGHQTADALPITHNQRMVLQRLSSDPNNADLLSELALCFATTLDLPEHATRMIQRCLYFQPRKQQFEEILRQITQGVLRPAGSAAVSDENELHRAVGQPDRDPKQPRAIVTRTIWSRPDFVDSNENSIASRNDQTPEAWLYDEIENKPAASPQNAASGKGRKVGRNAQSFKLPDVVKPAEPPPAHPPAPALVRTARDESENPLAKAFHEIQLGHLEQAEALCAEAAASDPQTALLPTAYNLIGLARYQKGEFEKAIEVYRRAIDLNTELPEPWFNLAVAAHESGRLNEACDAYETAVRLDPNHAKAWSNLGSLHFQANRVPEAVEACRKAVAIKPDYAKAWDSLSTALLEMGESGEARAAAATAVRLQPGFASAHLKLGVLDFQEDRFEEARDHLLAVLEKHPDSEIARCYLAMSWARLGRIDEAVACCHQVEEQNREHELLWNAWLEVTQACRETGKTAQALGAATKASALRPDDPKSWFHLGAVQEARGQLEDAVKSYRKAALLKADSGQVWTALGHALYRLKNYADAESAFNEALRIKPQDPMLHYDIGVTREKLGKLEEAVLNYREAVRLKPDFEKAWNNIGSVCLELHRIDQAVEALNQAITLKPVYTTAWFNLGVAHEQAGRPTEAIRALEHAVTLHPDFPEAWMHLSTCYRAAGDEEKAGQAVRRAIAAKESPDQPPVSGANPAASAAAS
jgi:tetratricopeptide (TPR) repeat protein